MKNLFTFPAILVFLCATLAFNSCSDEILDEPNELPLVRFLQPKLHSSYFAGDIMNIEIREYERYNTDASIEQVNILINGSSITKLDSKPYAFSYKINDTQPGGYTLSMVVTDDNGEQGWSEIPIRRLPNPEEFTDTRDGNVYRYVNIGNQTWMIDNLAFLPEVYPETEGSDILPRYYVYDYNGSDVSAAKQAENYSKFGVLYNWEAAKQACPEGWRLPTESDWIALKYYVETHIESLTGNDHEAEYLVHTSVGGRNYFGFSAIPAGELYGPYDPYSYFKQGPDGFAYLGSSTSWWSSTLALESGNNVGRPIAMRIEERTDKEYHHVSIGERESNRGLSIRCIKD